jgi:uncharacterized protein (TIGR04255 family)
MNLGKPPVIEAWVEFRFAVDEGVPAWDEATAEKFFKHHFADAFTIKDFVGHYEVEIEAGGGRPTVRQGAPVFDRARASNADGDRCLQAGRDVLIYNILRRRGVWPEYRDLRGEAMAAYGKYIDFAKSLALRSVGLHYRDEVAVPSEGPLIDLRDHITVYPEVPEGVFGPVSNFVMNLTLPDAATAGILNLAVGTVPFVKPDTTARELRIRLDWHLLSKSAPSTEPKAVSEWLDRAHNELTHAFERCFTRAAWQRFDPKED